MFRCLIIGALYLFANDIANGQISQQSAQRALRGLTTIALFMEGIDEAAESCGISQKLIRDAFLFPVSQSKIRILDDATAPGPTFHVLVNTLIQRKPGQCISSLSLAVVSYQKVKLDYTDEPASWAAVRLWEDDWLEVSVTERHPQQVRAAVENATKKFLTAWNLGNKP